MNSESNDKGWSAQEKKAWREAQKIQRSYKEEVQSNIDKLRDRFDISLYGQLTYHQKNYSLFLIKSKEIDPKKPNVLITGGVHGYETSGVHGALKFMSEFAHKFEHSFNFFCAPCISPWGYESINRWNPDAIDPNRNFYKNSPAEECSKLYEALKELRFLAHFDLHETTDTDNTIFRPLLEKRDGVKQDLWEIPDGFYLVGDTSRIENAFQNSIISEVEKVTHIAPTDQDGKIIGVELSSRGVINYDVKKLHLCAGLTNAKYVTTTEVYPDSPRVTDEESNMAQVSAIIGGLEFLENIN